MKVILLQDIAKLGKRGEVKDVADGYAINVLIKKGMALLGTPAELLKWKQKEESKLHKKELETNTFLQLVQKIHHSNIEITDKKVDEKGHLFAAVHERDIAEAIYKVTSFSLDPKQISIPTPIKIKGNHKVELKQGSQKELITIIVK